MKVRLIMFVTQYTIYFTLESLIFLYYHHFGSKDETTTEIITRKRKRQEPKDQFIYEEFFLAVREVDLRS